MLKAAIEAGIDLDATRIPPAGGDEAITLLHIASLWSLRDAVEQLLDAGADPAVASSDGRTPLHVAVGGGHDNIALALLKAGADPLATDCDGYPAWWTVGGFLNSDAPRVALPAVLEQVESSGTRVVEARESESHGTPMHLAAFWGKADRIAWLLDHGADVHAVDNDGDTPLHVAALRAHDNDLSLDGLHSLLAAGADPDRRNNEGKTPLDLCCMMALGESARTEPVEMLLDAGADADGGQDLSPLQFAVTNHQPDVVRVLVKGGANVNAGVPLHMIASVDDPATAIAIARILIDAGTDVDARDARGETVLHAISHQLYPVAPTSSAFFWTTMAPMSMHVRPGFALAPRWMLPKTVSTGRVSTTMNCGP